MEVLDAAARHLTAAKSSAINAAKELQKLPLSMEHGLRLLKIIQDLDRIASFLNTDEAEATAATALRTKPKKRSRLRKKQDQGHPAVEAGVADRTTTPPANETLVLPRGSKLIG